MAPPHIADAVARRIERNRSRIPDDSRIQRTPPSILENPALLTKHQDDATLLLKLWVELVPVEPPHHSQFFDWAEKFGAALLEKAVRRVAEKARKRSRAGDPMTPEDAHKYTTATLRNMAADSGR